MSLNKLYEQMILEHNKNPRNFKKVDPCTHSSHGHNPLCGDDYVVSIRVKDGIIDDIGFEGMGCAISKASGSLMTETLIGKPIDFVLDTKDKFINLVTEDDAVNENLGKLVVFEGVKKYPVRVKCAALVWRALEDALINTSSNNNTVTTE
ncbi:SUF system NifU family Fe-S cluster assembly protein [bacterium]|nr:SUF system NifU family Fe-S cluster assembly protein [bacterium]